MAIAFQCDCGKAYSVPDEFAARRTKCKACGVALTVPAAALGGDDFEVVEGPPPLPSVKAVKSVAVADDEPVRKRRKKAKYKGMTRDEERDFADGLNATAVRRVRVLRSAAFVACGVVIVIGIGVLFAFRDDFVAVAEGPPVRLYAFMAVAAVMGVAAIGKGAWGLLSGQMDE